MLQLKMKVNKNLLPIKGHYFFFNAGTAPLVPYLSTYARQLGFSSTTVGLIYTILPIFGLIAKPLFGVIADKLKIQKLLFILFQIVIIISFSSIYFIPENPSVVSIQLACGEKGLNEKCDVTTPEFQSENFTCDMSCDMSSPIMWQTICEHWEIPQYCYSLNDTLQYSAHVTDVIFRNNKCYYMNLSNVSFQGGNYAPHCRNGKDYVNLNEPCTLSCSYNKRSIAMNNEKIDMTCQDSYINYHGCSSSLSQFEEFSRETLDSECQVSCDLNRSSPWHLMEICDGWKANKATCHPRTRDGSEYPSTLSFTMHLSTANDCDTMQLHHIVLNNGSIHYPSCANVTQHDIHANLLYANCKMICENTKINGIFEDAALSANKETTEYTRQFWLFFMLMIISWIGQAVVVTFADAICFDLLGSKVSHYGKQRLWGSVGWGLFSLLTGTLIDTFSEGSYKDYTIAFILMFVFMSGDVIVSCFLKIDSTKMSLNILADVGTLLSSLPTFIFMLWTITVGLCTGLLWNFLFWLIEDIAKAHGNTEEYTKTLQGLVGAIQTFCGEIPFLFVSGYILKKVGHTNMMSLVQLAFGVRFILYSFVTNPWWILPIEIFQGITFGMFYPTMTSYASIVSPPGTETTVQGLVGAIFEGVGTSLGSFIGGRLYETYGGWITFRAFGIGSLICYVIHAVAQIIFKDKIKSAVFDQGYSSVALRNQQVNDFVAMSENKFY